MSHVVEINRIEDLAGIRLAWNALLGETPGASFFQSLDWLEVYWRHFGAGQKLRVLVVYSCQKPIGILPLVVRSRKTKLGMMRVLTYPLDDWGCFYGPVGPNPTATLRTAMRHVRHSDRDWDLIDLRWVNADKHDRRRTEMSMRAVGFQADRRHTADCGIADLSRGWDDYWAGRKSHWRTNVRGSEKKLARSGLVEHVRYRPAGAARGEDDPRWDLYDACERIAGQSWQGSSTTGTTLSHESIRAFMRDMHRAAVRAGAVDLNLLLVDGRPVAFAYNYHFRGTVSGLRMGFDANLAPGGAGTVLVRRMLRDSCRRGDLTFNLGAEYLDCKRRWLTHTEAVYAYAHYPLAAPRAQVIRVKRWIARQITRPAKAASL